MTRDAGPAPRTVAGATALPPGFAHPHASEEARAVAERGMILRVQVGSGVHGTAVSGEPDRAAGAVRAGRGGGVPQRGRRRAGRGRAPVRLPAGRRAVPRLPAGAEGGDGRPAGSAHEPARAGRRARLRHQVRDARLTRLADSPGVPAEPDRGWVDAWLHRSYTRFSGG